MPVKVVDVEGDISCNDNLGGETLQGYCTNSLLNTAETYLEESENNIVVTAEGVRTTLKWIWLLPTLPMPVLYHYCRNQNRYQFSTLSFLLSFTASL